MSILCFVAVLELFPGFLSALSATASEESDWRLQRFASIISLISGQPYGKIMSGLKEGSTLISCGIVIFEPGFRITGSNFRLLDGLGEILFQQHEGKDTLIKKFLKKAVSSSLTLQDFPHLALDILATKAYLVKVLSSKEPGANILFYGVPGTGKTECVKALAAELQADLYEIAFTNDDGYPIYGESRLHAYNLCQKILRGSKNSILIFDEIEDVFTGGGTPKERYFGIENVERTRKTGKAWINRTLEQNETPTIWVTNDTDIDPAYLRRFDYSVRFSVPPQQVRISIARHHLAQFDPPESWLTRIASSEQMSPAQYERAAKVARLASNGNMEQARLLVEQTLDRSASLLGQKRVPARNVLHTGYDLRFVNTSISAEKIIAGLSKRPRGPFCFYGPAGTGKSEFARHIADSIGKQILVKRASDILSMWVGEAEQNIAEMFSEARQQEAVLVLDEADSFLADRRDARNSWEVTQVNELLTQMEAFEGIFVCTTNLLEKLDQASLRRFAFKVKFDFLTADQRWEMFKKELVRLGGAMNEAAEFEPRIRGLEKLTPGDFSVAARQFEVMDVEVTPGELFRQLQEECKIKGSGSGKIGFMLQD
jgi:SpoVK/Ycf46/Vps4 family AAA+-type ATPase